MKYFVTNHQLTRADWNTLEGAITAWAKKTADPSSQRWDYLLRDQQRVVYEFFKWVKKRPQQVTPADVAARQEELRMQRDPVTHRLHYSPATIYSMVSSQSANIPFADVGPTVGYGETTRRPGYRSSGHPTSALSSRR